jgi:sugar lactone lactonase YvrE
MQGRASTNCQPFALESAANADSGSLRSAHISTAFRVVTAFRVATVFRVVTVLTSTLVLAGCGGAKAPPEQAAPPPPPPPPPAEHIPPPVEEEADEPPVKIISDAGFATPESVYYDKKHDVYLVSNINGSSHAKDDNGFISKITPDGKVTAKFIDGADEKVTLNAPKGMTISQDVLYIADIDHLRMFDAATGAPKGEIPFPGSSLLNDVATGKAGVIYVTDTGVNEKWETDGKDAVYTLSGDKPKKLYAHKTKLGNPNGILAGDGGAWIVTGTTGELLWLSDAGKLEKAQKISSGWNDGIAHTPDGLLLISSWADEAVYAGKPGGEFKKEISGLEAPADIGFDCTRGRLLIPLFKKDTVILHTLGAASTETSATPHSGE